MGNQTTQKVNSVEVLRTRPRTRKHGLEVPINWKVMTEADDMEKEDVHIKFPGFHLEDK